MLEAIDVIAAHLVHGDEDDERGTRGGVGRRLRARGELFLGRLYKPLGRAGAVQSEHYGLPILSVHAPCLLVTQRVWSPDPWQRLRRSAELAETLGRASDGSPVVPKGWPPRYAIRRIAWHVLDHAWEIEDRAIR